MIERAQSAEFINYVANHPAVRSALLGPPGPIDMTAVVKNPHHCALTGEHGYMLMVQHVTGIYELHTTVLPEGRGEWAYQMALACVDWLFTRTNATEVFTRVPAGNLAAKALTKACGAILEHTVWQNLGKQTLVEVYSGRIQDWIKIAPGLVERGQKFHELLHSKATAMGRAHPIHEDNDWHDRHVGAAAGMITGGQPIKGVMVYDRWAAMALTPAITLLSLDPVVIDIRDCKIKVTGDDFEILRDH